MGNIMHMKTHNSFVCLYWTPTFGRKGSYKITPVVI